MELDSGKEPADSSSRQTEQASGLVHCGQALKSLPVFNCGSSVAPFFDQTLASVGLAPIDVNIRCLDVNIIDILLLLLTAFTSPANLLPLSAERK